MFQHITADTVLSSVQALAAGEQPEIERGILLAHVLPSFLGLEPSPEVQMDPPELPIAFRRLQRRFHAQAVASWGVLGRDGDFVLVPLGEQWEAAHADRDAAIAKGFYLCGTIGLAADDTPLVLPEPDADADSLRTLLHACLVSFWKPAHGHKIESPELPTDNSAAWLAGLFALPDSRTDGGSHA